MTSPPKIITTGTPKKVARHGNGGNVVFPQTDTSMKRIPLPQPIFGVSETSLSIAQTPSQQAVTKRIDISIDRVSAANAPRGTAKNARSDGTTPYTVTKLREVAQQLGVKPDVKPVMVTKILEALKYQRESTALQG